MDNGQIGTAEARGASKGKAEGRRQNAELEQVRLAGLWDFLGGWCFGRSGRWAGCALIGGGVGGF